VQTFGIWQEIRLDWRVAAVAVLLTMVTTIATGLAPAVQAVRVDVRSALAAAGSRGITGGRRRMARKALVVAQLAFGVTLLAAAGLFLRTLDHLQRLEPGFDGRGVLAASVSLQDARYRTSERVSWLYDRTLQRIRSTPGVESAAVGLHVPYEPWLNAAVDVRDGVIRDTVRPTAMNYVTPGYLTALRIPVLSGRGIDERDTSAGTPVAVVNRTFVRTYLGEREPVGTYIRVRMDGAERLIVGVIGDVQQQPTFGRSGPIGAAIPAVFIPAAQTPGKVFELVHRWFSPRWVVRGASDMAAMRAALESALRDTDPALPVASFDTFDSVRLDALRVQRLQAILLSTFAFIATLLAAVGVHGLMAQSVVERTREMGIRMALGATLREIFGSAVAPGLRLAALGTILGLALAAACSRLLTSFIYGVAPTDPATFVLVAAILLVVALAASAIAALRLLRLDPAMTLRQE
jgi:predicted permease